MHIANNLKPFMDPRLWFLKLDQCLASFTKVEPCKRLVAEHYVF